MDDEEVRNADQEFEDVDEDEDDQELIAELQFSKTGPSAKVITKESLLGAQNQDLRRVIDLLSLREHHARTLLIHFRWDVEKLITKFIEEGKDTLCFRAGVKVGEDNNSSSLHLPAIVTCNICMEEASPSEVTEMDCGHFFCNNCWKEHFIVKISEGQSRHIRCMAYKCNVICDEEKIRNLVISRDPILAEKYNRFLLESYIEDNKRVKWCPSVPHCGNAIQYEDDEFCEIECACGLQFCFSCSGEAHSPCSCSIWEAWEKKCADESETHNWIKSNTMDCPTCHKPVEKNGGCNIVRCICKTSFCWFCGVPSSNHRCGRYNGKTGKDDKSSRSNLMRYLHYYTRYKGHLDSLKLESKLERAIKTKTLNLEQKGHSEFGWVRDGLYRLSRSRRILLYSYPLAYYIFDEELAKNEMNGKEIVILQNLFEDLQQQLEETVEKLSMHMEEPFDNFVDDKYSETRMKILNLSVLIDKRCEKLYDWIENDLFGSLRKSVHKIAPYNSQGVVKASEIPVLQDEKGCKGIPDYVGAGATEVCQNYLGIEPPRVVEGRPLKRARRGT